MGLLSRPLLYVIIELNAASHMACTQNGRAAGIAFNLMLIRVAQNRANPEPEVPTFIGDSTIERAIPAAPRRNSETVASSREGV
jgi:hypothetical protein